MEANNLPPTFSKIRKIVLTIMAIVFSVMVFNNCNSPSNSGSGEVKNDDNVIEDDGGENGGNQDDEGGEKSGVLEIPSGSYAIFIVKSNVNTESIPAGGGNISWDSGVKYLIRYIPSLNDYTSLDSALYESYGCKSILYPITLSGTKFYTTRLCPDYPDGYSRVTHIRQINASTGVKAGDICSNFYQSGTQRYFVIINNKVFYRKSGGDLVYQNLPCSGEKLLLESGAEGNSGTLYGIADQLISVHDDTYYNDQYTIRKHNQATGAIEQTLLTLDEDEVTRFFEGDDALYWYLYNESTKVLKVYRYTLTGAKEEILNQTLSYDMRSISIDSSNGKVLIAYEMITQRNNSGYTIATDASFYLYDVATTSLEEQDISNFFFGQRMQILYKQ